ncbi:MAG: beta-galactosidase [Caldivirga sp.]|uniref:beta-galactosidase n=1 Tax=Caldivirga sp. TaxID=2080243 RepID=UPI003D0EC859
MLLCGEVHYFRVPRGLWEDRLLKLRQAGLNCLNTYFAWNYHEVEPGLFDFSGEKDVDEYLSKAEELGLKIVARVGPYICSEWDNGGHPDWLLSRDLVPRSLDSSYWPYAERWLRVILPIIVKHQEPNGGVTIVQLENEYFWGDAPLHMRLAELARQIGVTAKLYTNVNRYVRNTIYTDALDLYPSPWDLNSVLWSIKDLLETQGGRPKILEYEGGWFSTINRPLPTSRGSFPPDWTRILLATALAYGSDVVSFYMFHGGTNFGYWTGRWITTTYDYEASIREWGELSDRYYKVKLLTPLAELIDGSETEGESYDNGRLLVIRRKGDLRLKFYINNTEAEWVDGNVRIKARGVKVIPSNLSIRGITISETNLSLLTVRDSDVLLYGDAGEEFTIRLKGGLIKSCLSVEHHTEGDSVVLSGRVPDELGGCLIEGKGNVRVLILSELFASRTWIMNDYYVPSNIYLIRGGDYNSLLIEGKEGVNTLYLPFKSSRGRYVPELDMTRIELNVNVSQPNVTITQVTKGSVGLRRILKINGVKPLEELGLFKHGLYVYDSRLNVNGLIGVVAHDYVTVINNGRITASGFIYVKANANAGDLRIIVESTGHPNDGAIPFFTGLQSPVLVNQVGSIKVDSWEYGALDLSSRLKPGIATNYSHTTVINREIREYLPRVKWVKDTGDLGKPNNAVIYYRGRVHLNEARHIVLRISKNDQWAAMVVFINGEEVYRGHGDDPFETTVYGGLRVGDVEIVIALLRYGIREVNPTPGNVEIDLWSSVISDYDLGLMELGEVRESAQLPLTVSEPSTIKLRFTVDKPSDTNAPLYAELSGKVHALIFLNGKLIGRYYPGGSQSMFYLPEPYLSRENELTILATPAEENATVNITFKPYTVTKIINLTL